jgi:hypothetical protein
MMIDWVGLDQIKCTFEACQILADRVKSSFSFLKVQPYILAVSDLMAFTQAPIYSPWTETISIARDPDLSIYHLSWVIPTKL